MVSIDYQTIGYGICICIHRYMQMSPCALLHPIWSYTRHINIYTDSDYAEELHGPNITLISYYSVRYSRGNIIRYHLHSVAWF